MIAKRRRPQATALTLGFEIARLEIRRAEDMPVPTASPAIAKTIGVAGAACPAAVIAAGPAVTMTSTLRRAISVAISAKRSLRPSVQRYSIVVGSLARPGGNVTGLSIQHPDTAGKRLELLREVVPDIAPAFESLKGRAGALYICADPLVITNRVRINTLALGARLPTVFGLREYVEAGGLMSYGPNTPDLFRRAADFVDKILRGAKPADLPVEQPTKFELIFNLTTAKALGLTIPESFLLRADEVIE
jgi:hypothetical protein